MTVNIAGNSDGSFYADPEKCIACGQCVADCPADIIAIDNGVARVEPGDMEECLLCQHCLAICPTAAVTVAGRDPARAEPVGLGDPAALDLLVRSRRSIRTFAPEPVDRATLDRVLVGASHAPTGVNARHRRLCVIHDPDVMDDIRARSCRALVDNAAALPGDDSWLAAAAGAYLEKGKDVVFRTAPHLIVVSAGPGASTGRADAIIFLSYFELLAQANGIATVWCGMVDMMLRFLPETRALFGIPADHEIGYAMLFGRPGIRYRRTAQYEPEELVWWEGNP